MGKGAKTKGYIKNMTTGRTRKFLYNPDSYSTDRSNNLNEFSAPGISYPDFEYVNGSVRNVQVSLFLYGDRSQVITYTNFLLGFFPREDSKRQFRKIPYAIFAFGNFTKKCIIESMSEDVLEFHDDLRPKISIIHLTLKVVG